MVELGAGAGVNFVASETLGVSEGTWRSGVDCTKGKPYVMMGYRNQVSSKVVSGVRQRLDGLVFTLYVQRKRGRCCTRGRKVDQVIFHSTTGNSSDGNSMSCLLPYNPESTGIEGWYPSKPPLDSFAQEVVYSLYSHLYSLYSHPHCLQSLSEGAS